MKRDTVTTMELLPMLFVCVLTESSDNQAPVVTEILSVLGQETILESSLEASDESRSRSQTSGNLQ